MGKKSSAPAAPDYQQLAQNTAISNRQNAQTALGANRYNEVGPYGEVTWALRPGADSSNPQAGDFIRTTQLSGAQAGLQGQTEAAGMEFGNFARDGLAGFQPDDVARDKLTDALYRRGTQYYDRRFGAEQGSLETKLLNSGLARGSEAYQRAMADFNERKDTAYADAADRAVIGGEQQSQVNQANAWNRLLSALEAQRGAIVGAPQSANTAPMQYTPGADALSAGTQQYNDALEANNANNANRARPWQIAGSLAAAYLTGGASLAAQAAAQRAQKQA